MRSGYVPNPAQQETWRRPAMARQSRVSPEQAQLFLISILILFLELACIRWFAAHVVFLTFFTNVVLLAAFLGMSIGCLLAERRRNHLAWTPLVLAAVLVIGLGLEAGMELGARRFLDVGSQARPQMVFFGAEEHTDSLATVRVPMEAVAGFFFVMIALVFVGPGQELGLALNRLPNRVLAYTVNIAGSVVGIV